jgi:Haem-binding uptake, Tiki superfamily, ChaN
MSFRSVAAKNVVLRMVGVMTVAGAALVTVSVANESFIRAQSRQIAPAPKVRLPDESTGIDEIARTLVSSFDQVDIVALGEAHQRKLDSDLRIAVVRHPDFAKKVRSIVVEFGSTSEQSTLDRYIRGENVSSAQLAQVWKTTTQAANRVWDSPIYPDFLAAVREVNSKLPADARIRVFGGDPGPGDNRSRETAAVSVLKQQVLQKHGKSLVIYGGAHFYRTMDADYLSSMGEDIGIVRMLEMDYPGRTLAVIPIGGIELPRSLNPPVAADYRKFDRALKTQVRPVLVPLDHAPFRDFTAEEFMGDQIFSCRGPGGCRSIFQGSRLTLGQMADACVYVGADAGR